MKRNIFKKMFVIFTLILCFSLISCSNDYNVTFVLNNGEENIIKTYQKNDLIEFPNPTKEGYTFKGWKCNDSLINIDEYKITADITFEAEYEINTYTYKFICDGIEIYSGIGEHGSTITPPTPAEKTGFSFVEWKDFNQTLTKDVEFHAIYEEKTYKVTYYVDDQIIEEKTFKYSESYQVLTTATKEDDDTYTYTFKEWKKTGDKTTGAITYTAVFNKEEKTKKFKSLEGLKVSIMGDSITTFYSSTSTVNSYYSVEGSYYYPKYCSTVSSWDLTWWGRLITNNKMTLGINNAYSGSCAGGSGSNAGYQDSRVNSLIENGQPDIFIYYLGTNDVCAGYSSKDFEDKLRLTLTKLDNISSPQIFLVKLGYSAYTGMKYSDSLRIEYNNVIEKIAKEKGYGIINLDDYIVEDNCSIYLHDNLHYNLKGTELLSLICEKDIKEFNGLSFTKEIKVEHKEVLPEGVVAYCTVTANDGKFWSGTNYASYIYLSKIGTENEFSSPLFSYRICFSKDTSDNKYKVVKIITSGTKDSYEGEYAITVSSSYSEYKSVEEDLKKISLGDIVEFENIDTMPCKLTFKKGEGGTVTPPVVENDDPVTKEGYLHIGSFNKGEWSVYDKKVILYEQAKLDRGSTYINFRIISLTKVTDNTYQITNKKDSGPATTFDSCDYYILIYSSLDVGDIYNNCKVGDIVTIIGDITTGDCDIDF